VLDPAQEPDDEVRNSLHLANALLDISEREVIEAQMAAHHDLDTERVEELAEMAEVSAEEVAGWTFQLLGVLRWRADRLQRALGRHAGEQGTPDPVLVAARNAAAVASLLITYREASELWATANSAEELQDVPGETLGLAATFLTQIGETIRDIAS
jgi:hypothetical protein